MQTFKEPRVAFFLKPLARRARLRGRARAESGTGKRVVRSSVFSVPAKSGSRSVTRALVERLPRSLSTAECLDNKEVVFRYLVEQYGASLYYFVLKRVGHVDDAEDITQQAFVEAVSGLDSYRGEAELSTWIFGIATNLARNHINRAPQFRHRFESDEVLEDCESAGPQPCESLSQRQGLELVTQAMALMPPEMARALNLVAVEDMSYEDAAATLHIPVGTVRSRVSRARAAVRKHLDTAGFVV